MDIPNTDLRQRTEHSNSKPFGAAAQTAGFSAKVTGPPAVCRQSQVVTTVAVLSTARFGVTTDVRERLQVASYNPHSQAPGQHNAGREVGRTELGVGEAKQTACPVQQVGRTFNHIH